MTKLMTQSAYARARGVSRQYIHQLVKAGMIVLRNGRVDPRQADPIMAVQSQPLKRMASRMDFSEEAIGGLSAEEATLMALLLKTRIKIQAEKAKLLEIRAGVASGRLVDIETVKRAAFRRGRNIRDGMLAIPERITALVTAMDDPAEVNALLRKEIDMVLEELDRPIL